MRRTKFYRGACTAAAGEKLNVARDALLAAQMFEDRLRNVRNCLQNALNAVDQTVEEGYQGLDDDQASAVEVVAEIQTTLLQAIAEADLGYLISRAVEFDKAAEVCRQTLLVSD